MYRIKNQTDSTIIVFTKDKITNLILDEVEYKNGKVKEFYNYYYDDNNRLTAVERYHPYKKIQLPEILFEYNDKNEVIKKTNYVTGTTSATYWYYFYNENGLKIDEQCFLPGNLLKGKLKYFYTYELSY